MNLDREPIISSKGDVAEAENSSNHGCLGIRPVITITLHPSEFVSTVPPEMWETDPEGAHELMRYEMAVSGFNYFGVREGAESVQVDPDDLVPVKDPITRDVPVEEE